MITPTVDSAYTYSTAPLLKGVVNLLAGESFVIKVTSPSLVDTDYTSFTIVGNTWSLQLSSLVAGVYTITPKVYETATPTNFVTGTGTLEVALFTFVIPFKSGAKETLTWLTEILLSNNGKEQRRQLKSLPRMTLQGTYPVNTNINLTVANEIYSLLGKLTLIPLWHEAQLVSTISQSANLINIDTRYSSYRVGDYCLIFKKYSEYELVLITTVTASTLLGDILADYTNAFVLPVKSGIITNNQSSAIGTSESLELSYWFKDLIDISEDSPTLFKYDDVYSDDWFVESELSSSLTNRMDINNFESGVFTFVSPWDTNKIKASMFFLLDGLKEVFEFKQFLYRRQGRLRPFWLSSYKSDFIPDRSILGTTVIGTMLRVLKNRFQKVFDDKENIAIHFKDRSFTFTTILSITIQSLTIDLTLADIIPKKYSDITFISFAYLVRLDSDSIELSYETNGVVTSKVPIIECSPFLAYRIIATPTLVTEGSTVTCDVITSGVPDGTVLYYTVLDITTEGGLDISPSSGSITILSGTATFNLSTLTDVLVENFETFQVQLRITGITGQVVAISQIISILDPLDWIFRSPVVTNGLASNLNYSYLIGYDSSGLSQSFDNGVTWNTIYLGDAIVATAATDANIPIISTNFFGTELRDLTTGWIDLINEYRSIESIIVLSDGTYMLQTGNTYAYKARILQGLYSGFTDRSPFVIPSGSTVTTFSRLSQSHDKSTLVVSSKKDIFGSITKQTWKTTNNGSSWADLGFETDAAYTYGNGTGFLFKLGTDLYKSPDGLSIGSVITTGNFEDIAISQDGLVIVIVGFNLLKITTDGGVTWTTENRGFLTSVVLAPDGTQCAISEYSTGISTHANIRAAY